MNEWFRHPLFKEGEDKSIEADGLDRQNQRDLAATMHFQAAEAFAKLAQLVPADHPHTRSDIAIAAAVSYGCAGHYDRAIKFAELMLAQQGALSARGRGELTKLIAEYAPIMRATMPLGRRPTLRAALPEHRMRAVVRGAAAGKPEAA